MAKSKKIEAVVNNAVAKAEPEKVAETAPVLALSPIGELMDAIKQDCKSADAAIEAAMNAAGKLRHITQCVFSIAHQANATEGPFKASKMIAEARKVIKNSVAVRRYEGKIFGLLGDCGVTQDEDKNYIVDTSKGAQQKGQDLINSVNIQDYESEYEKRMTREKAAQERAAAEELDKADNAPAEVAGDLIKLVKAYDRVIKKMENNKNSKGSCPRLAREYRKRDIVKGLIAAQEKLAQALAGSKPAE